MSTGDRLLADVAELDPGERMRRAVTAARALDPQPRAALLADLAGRGVHERRLAVAVAVATGDSRHLAAATRDPNPSVRARALAAAGAGALAAVLADGPLADRGRAAARLRRGGHEPVADAALPGVRARWGDTEAAALLAGCSAPVVAALLPGLGYAVAGWAALAARHPDAVLAHAGAELAALPAEGRAHWWSASGRIVGALLARRPAELLGLAETTLTGPLPPTLLAGVHRLLAVDAGRVLRLVLADPDRVAQLARIRLGRAARTRLATLPDADLAALLRASGPAPRLLVALLRALPPSRREPVYDLAHAGRDLSADVLSDEVLAVLPHARRHAEARRILALPAVAGSRPAARRIAASLPFAEARALLEADTRSPDADERADAYERLVRGAAATGDPAVVTGVLGRLDRIPNEQDPVRARVLGAVAQVRPGLIEAAALPALDVLVTGAVDARDASAASRDALHRIVFGLVGEPSPVVDWALGTIDRLGAWRYGAVLGPGLRTLPRGREQAVFERLRSRLDDGLRRGEAWTLLAVAQALGRRGWAMPELQEMLGRATRIPDDAVVTRAVDAWLAPPRPRLARVEELLARDPSLVTLPAVWTVLARRRPARLLALAGRPVAGRRGTGGSWWLPVLPASGLRIWAPAQVDAYTALLRRAVDDAGLPRATRASVARTLAALDPATALVGHPDVLVAEAALTGLGRGDRPYEAMRTLLGHLDSDRARVALPAAARCAREIPPEWLAGLLDIAPAKVTARKELARWRGRFRPAGARDALLATWGRPGEHRDVRLAVLAALRSWPDDERVWAVLDEAGRGDRYLAGAVAAQPPASLAPGLRPRYGDLVRALAAHPDDDIACRALLALAGWVRWAPGACHELTAALVDVTTTATWRAAATTVLTATVWTAQPDLLPGIVATLVAGEAGPDAGRLRDRPARQRVQLLVDGLCGQPAVSRRHPGPVLRVADLLAADPTTLAAAARLRAALIGPGATFVDDLRALAGLVADRPLVATAAAAQLAVRDWEPSAVGPAVDALAGGHLAVTLTATAGAAAGWTDGWRARLRTLRAHADADVRAAALAVTTAPE